MVWSCVCEYVEDRNTGGITSGIIEYVMLYVRLLVLCPFFCLFVSFLVIASGSEACFVLFCFVVLFP